MFVGTDEAAREVVCSRHKRCKGVALALHRRCIAESHINAGLSDYESGALKGGLFHSYEKLSA